MRMYVTGSLYLKAVVNREHNRAMKANRRAFRRAMTKMRKSAQSCPFHHASQPSIDIEGERANTMMSMSGKINST